MGGHRRGQSPGHRPAPHPTAARPSKRRNTLHSTIPEASSAPAWTSTLPNYAALQPSLVPLYLPFWQYPQLLPPGQALLVPHPAAVSVPVSEPVLLTGPVATDARTESPQASHPPHPPHPPSLDRRLDGGHGRPPHTAAGMGLRSPMTFGDNIGNMSPVPPDPAHPPRRRPSAQHPKPSPAHHANSVPSTPKQHPRKLSLKSRSPSPDGFNPSPRSSHSDSNRHLPALRRVPVGCRFETGMAFHKRRIPYSIGTDRLEKAAVPPPTRLSPTDEAKLTAAMQVLYRHLLPSPESEQRRAQFVAKLERMLHAEWPAGDIKVRVFGSSGNLLCTSESDGQCSAPAQAQAAGASTLTGHSGHLHHHPDEGARAGLPPRGRSRQP